MTLSLIGEYFVKISTILGSVALLIATTGCAGAFGEKKPDPNLVAQLGAWERVEMAKLAVQTENKDRAEENRIRFAEAQARIAEAMTQACNGNSTCVLGVGSSLTNMQLANTIEEVAAKSAAPVQAGMNMPVYQPRPSGWRTAGDFLLRLAGIAVPEWRMDRAGKYGLESTRAQFAFLEGVMTSGFDAAAAMQPSITVGGNYNTGTYTDVEGGYIGGNAEGPGAGIGNFFAQDNSTRTSGNYNNVGDSNTQDNSQGQINGDQNRVTSPDTIDNSDNSDNRNCAAAPGGNGASGSSTTGNSPGGSGAAGGSANCG